MNTTKSKCLFKNKQLVRNLLSLFIVVTIAFPADAQNVKKQKPIQIQEQGSFPVGGTVITNPGTFDPNRPTPDGQTFRGDHAYVFYQITVNARKYPLVYSGICTLIAAMLWLGFFITDLALIEDYINKLKTQSEMATIERSIAIELM